MVVSIYWCVRIHERLARLERAYRGQMAVSRKVYIFGKFRSYHPFPRTIVNPTEVRHTIVMPDRQLKGVELGDTRSHAQTLAGLLGLTSNSG